MDTLHSYQLIRWIPNRVLVRFLKTLFLIFPAYIFLLNLSSSNSDKKPIPKESATSHNPKFHERRYQNIRHFLAENKVQEFHTKPSVQKQVHSTQNVEEYTCPKQRNLTGLLKFTHYKQLRISDETLAELDLDNGNGCYSPICTNQYKTAIIVPYTKDRKSQPEPSEHTQNAPNENH